MESPPMMFDGFSRRPVMTDSVDMPHILLVGTDASLLEGLAQSLSALGHGARVATTFADARELSTAFPPLVAVIERAMAAASPSEALGLKLAAGGTLVIYRSADSAAEVMPHVLRRNVLADLTLPLERNRLSALVQHVCDRAVAAGRGRTSGERELTS
jgi:DNA-binding NtrC family response regulator